MTGSSYWRISICWGNGVPGAGDDAFIVENDGSNRVVTYDYGPGVLLNSVTVDNTGTGTNTLFLTTPVSGPTSLSATAEFVGFNGRGAVLQGTGNNTVAQLYLGFGVGSSGAYTLSNSATVVLGDSVIGGGDFEVGYGSGAGAFTMKGGSLTVCGNERVGFGGNGVVSQTGGSHALLARAVGEGELDVGYSGGSGTYTISGGSISSAMYVGVGGAGVFNQNGGSVAGRVTVGCSNGVGTYNL
jgi:hypothetical protein